jgi:calcium-dependent protein kinase
VKLHYIKENPNYFFLVQELMKGGTLRDLIIDRYTNNQTHLFRDEECALITKNILEGLNYIHHHKVIHRDVKPENIMFMEKNNLNSLKICDFGVSTTVDYLEYEKDSYSGTLIYMPPEIFKRQANETSDIWAAGFILYILCSGGSHPLYKACMKKEQYKVILQTIKEWNLPESFPM